MWQALVVWRVSSCERQGLHELLVVGAALVAVPPPTPAPAVLFEHPNLCVRICLNFYIYVHISIYLEARPQSSLVTVSEAVRASLAMALNARVGL